MSPIGKEHQWKLGRIGAGSAQEMLRVPLCLNVHPFIRNEVRARNL